MNEPKTAILLVGSPKGLARSTGSRRGAVLLDALQDRGWSQEKVHLFSNLRSEEGRAHLAEKVAGADLVILAAPLYVDSLPSPVIEALELLHAERAALGKPKRFVAFLNCGFPEASHNATATDICRLFAEAMGWTWAGSLSMGGTGTTGTLLQRVMTGAAEALAGGGPVPEGSVTLAAQPRMKTWLYILGGNIMWRRLARRQKAQRSLSARPYAR